MRPFVCFTICLTALLSFNANAFNQGSNPTDFLFPDEKLEVNFHQLKLSAKVTDGHGHMPWSDTYWPAQEGGIAVRYMGNGSAFKNVRYTLTDLKKMSQDQIARLAPSEKFDILRSRYDYPLTREVLAQYSPNDPSWWGICHGWTPSAANYPEPDRTTAVNKEGIVIPFGSSDVKAIIAYYYAWKAAQFDQANNPNWGFDATGSYIQKDPSMVHFIYRTLGKRCDDSSGGCSKGDIDAGAFHLAMTNVVGRYHRSFAIDVSNDSEVWNQPILGYESEVIKRSNLGSMIKMHLYYLSEKGPSFEPHRNDQKIEDIKLVYWVFYDNEGKITGGKWKIRSQAVDMLWRASRVPFLGEFTALNDIYKPLTPNSTQYVMAPGYTPGLTDITADQELKFTESAPNSTPVSSTENSVSGGE